MKILTAVGFLFGFFNAASSSAADLAVGDDAPPFALVGSDGNTYRLSDFRDKKAVVVAWFPKAATPG